MRQSRYTGKSRAKRYTRRFTRQLFFHSHHVLEIGPTRKHAQWKGTKSQIWDKETIRNQDAIVIATHHKAFDLPQLANWASLIIDTRNAMAAVEGPATIVKA